MNALAQFRSTASRPWDRTLASHLLNRAAFGGLPQGIDTAVAWGMERTVDYLLNFDKIVESLPPPATPETPEYPRRMFANLTEKERRQKLRELQRANRQAMEGIREWWIRRMLRTGRPLQEKMALFWHGHFTSSAEDVKSARHMLMQNEFLRRNCLGNFRDLLIGISRDPAMLKYLDNNTNRRQHPNENYARELMELFTMGIGHYTEDDVKAAARAFTGWTFRGDEFAFNENEHDYGAKTFLGETGNLDGTDVIDIILKQPCTARFMAQKLLRFFVTDHPDPGAVEETAALLRASHYEFKPTLRAIFCSEYFYSPSVYRAQIKSPVQLVVGACLGLGVTVNERALVLAMRGLGQDLLFPPNVKGWDGGETWINTTTLLLRYNLSAYLLGGQVPLRGTNARGRPFAPRGPVTRFGTPTNQLAQICSPAISSDAAALVDSLVARLLQTRLNDQTRQWLIEQAGAAPVDERAARTAHFIMSTPEYQLC